MTMQTSKMISAKRKGTAPAESSMPFDVVVDGSNYVVHPGERQVDLLNRLGVKLAQVCYHTQLGPVQNCDTCLVDINGQLVRACATTISGGVSDSTVSSRASAAQQEAFDCILSNRMLCCTVCDNNNGNCTVPNMLPFSSILSGQVAGRR